MSTGALVSIHRIGRPINVGRVWADVLLALAKVALPGVLTPSKRTLGAR